MSVFDYQVYGEISVGDEVAFRVFIDKDDQSSDVYHAGYHNLVAGELRVSRTEYTHDQAIDIAHLILFAMRDAQ